MEYLRLNGMKFYKITNRIVKKSTIIKCEEVAEKIPSVKLLKRTLISDRRERFILTKLAWVKWFIGIFHV